MDRGFVQLLKSEGIADDTIQVLCSESIVSKRVLSFLHEEHLQKLLTTIRIGQHAIITNIWQKLVDEMTDSGDTTGKDVTCMYPNHQLYM